MANVILSQKEIGIPVRLEVRLGPISVLVDFVLVSVDEEGAAILVEGVDYPGESVSRNFVIVIEKGDEFTGGHFQGRI